MNKTRLDRLEQRLKQGGAPHGLVELLRRLRAEAGDTTPTPANLNLADTLAGVINLLPD